jgi:hypothetical protein
LQQDRFFFQSDKNQKVEIIKLATEPVCDRGAKKRQDSRFLQSNSQAFGFTTECVKDCKETTMYIVAAKHKKTISHGLKEDRP